ncbi:SQUAMOSA PROMOTER BINDING PROTEIN-LIKE 7, squamosa promoter binding protein-like 7 [Hibiscus trionum]|uniref:SQUAMOSA PROMOTER BINDING PROTEIN-LIKE 7, squamosa promoter binding protein-like 7 n=1 Tax=Hibiscus trionum TaxID=183268 RepID=A0A9W7LHY8_HIBTR|nr:SQUAMOSA PROMOTER BINDING PROTEIN-LIKE 7, squamosa promoter binding protein-like 7 [Hibiscus trionum]
MEPPASPPNNTPRVAHRSKDPEMDVHLPVTEADPTSSVWDWGDLLDFTVDDHFSVAFDDQNISPPPLEHSSLSPSPAPAHGPSPDPGSVPGPDRVRKRDPRMTCSNFIAGRVPCACPEIDAQMEKLEEEEAGVPGKKRVRTGRVGSGTCRCQVPGCGADITELKGYHRRHRVCLQCANSSTVLIHGETKRYCQQCGKFHLLTDFDEGKRSCRRKLERHNNRRRRKPVGSKTAVNIESQGDVQSEDIGCDGEAGKDDLSLSGQIAGEEPAFESEDGLVSAHCSDPMLQSVNNDSVVARINPEMDVGKEDSKFSISTYSSMCPTGRISFKLYDWNPAEFPRRLRHQIFQWLANMPVELEGYIRPGCTILTVFVSMPKNMWIKLSENPMTYMHDFVFTPGRMLYGRGFMTIHLNNMIFRTRKGGTSLVKIDVEMQAPRLHYVHPSCFEAGKPMEFVACGSNLLQPKFRFLVSFAGRYLPNDYCVASTHVHGKEDSPTCDHQLFKIYVPQTEPDLFGPVFIEVDNQSGLSNFIPVLIGDKEVCSEMKAIQQKFDASLFRGGSKISSNGSSCDTSTSQQKAYSELVLEIAWLLREPGSEIFQETTVSSQIQRFNCLLRFLIQVESTVILKKVVQNLMTAMDKTGFNGTNNFDMMLLQKYMDYARDILNNKLQKGERPVLLSEYIEREGKWFSRSSFTNDGLSIVPNGSQVFEERSSDKFRAMMASTTLTRSESVPLLNEEVIMNVNLSKECLRKSCSPISATTTLRSRPGPAVFVIATAAICLGICAVFFHPTRVVEFAVTIRRLDRIERGVPTKSGSQSLEVSSMNEKCPVPSFVLKSSRVMAIGQVKDVESGEIKGLEDFEKPLIVVAEDEKKIGVVVHG